MLPPPPAVAVVVTMTDIALGRVRAMRATLILVTSGLALAVALWALLNRMAIRTVMVVEGTTRMVAGVLQVAYVAARHAGAAVGLLTGTAGATMPAATVTVPA